MDASSTTDGAIGDLGTARGRTQDERVDLTQWLLSRGITPREIEAAASPMLLAARRSVGGNDGRYVSARETSERYGIDLPLLQRIQSAMGMPTGQNPDEPAYLGADAEAAARVHDFIALGLDADHVIHAIRVLSEGLSRSAEVMRSTALAAVMAPGATELDIARRHEEAVERIAPLLGPMLQDMMFFHLRHMMLETEAVTAGERADGRPLPGERTIAVAFADLVDFTKLGESLPPEDLERLARRLADITWEAAAPPVKMIKTIGDAVMLVSPDPAALLETVLTLLERTTAEPEFPRLKVGMAVGQAISRGGDWFGSPVNLASRITGTARPDSVLLSQSARESIGSEDPRFIWSRAGGRKFKGIDSEVELFRVRRAVGEEDQAAARSPDAYGLHRHE